MRGKPEWVASNPLARRILESEDSLARFVSRVFTGPDGGPMRLTPYQARFIYMALHRVWEGRPRFAFMASTRAGKTTATSVLGALMAIVYPNEDVIIVAPRQDQAEILYGHIRRYFETSPILSRLVDKAKPFRMDRMALTNGSIIRALSVGRPERVLGYGASTLIIDESAEIPDEVYEQYVLRLGATPRNGLPTVIVELSTPHRVNHFYRAWISGDYNTIRVTWRDAVAAGVMSREYVEYLRRVLPEHRFRVWYEAEWPSDSGMVYPPSLVRKRMTIQRAWASPRPGYRYFAGLDVAGGRGDCSALAIVAVPEGESDPHEARYLVVRVDKLCHRRVPTVVRNVSAAVSRFRVEVLGVDAVGVGLATIQYLDQELSVPVVPIRLQGETRVEAYELVRRLMEEERLELVNSEELAKQFQSYSYAESARSGRGYTIRKARSAHDDMADAVVYAVWTAFNRLRGRARVGPAIDLWR